MRYIVDGYNLFFRVQERILPLEQTRTLFLEKLSALLNEAALPTLIIFDSAPENGLDYASIKTVGNVDIAFSPKWESADEYILELIKGKQYPGRFTVVSSDKYVMRSAKSMGAQTLSIEQFVEFIHKKGRKKRRPGDKKTEETEANIKRLERIFTTKLHKGFEEH